MSNVPLYATCSATLPQNSSVYSGQLKNATTTNRLAVASVRVSGRGVNTLTKPIRARLYRVLTASITEGTPTAGTVARRNVLDTIAITGVSTQSLTLSGTTVTSPELLDTGEFKPDGGSWTFTKGYYVDPAYSLLVLVDDTNNAADIAVSTTFDIDM